MKIPFPVRAIPAITLKAWFTPPPLSAKKARRDAETVEGLVPVLIPTATGSPITGFELGTGPLVLALHGWGGRAAQMVPLARRLAAEGFRVVIPDLPGRAGGEPSDIKLMAAAVRALLDELDEPVAVVAHSLTGLMLRLAFPTSAPPAVAVLAPLFRVSDALDRFSEQARLLPWSRRGLRRGLEAWDPQVFPRLDEIAPTQLPGAEVLVLHDPDDPETPFATAAALVARRPATTMVPIEGVGHFGILSDFEALERVASFVSHRARVSAAGH